MKICPISEADSLAKVSPAAKCVDSSSDVATLATLATLRGELAKLKERSFGHSRFRHDQACWAAEMFLNEWESLAVDLNWTADDIFSRAGLAYWLETDVVQAIGPEHAITEAGRVFDRITRKTWIDPFAGETEQ